MEKIPPQKSGKFLRTLVGRDVFLEFQESEGNRIIIEIPGILERRNTTGQCGYYIKNTDVQISAREIKGVYYPRVNGRKMTGIVLSQKSPRMLKYENGRLSL